MVEVNKTSELNFIDSNSVQSKNERISEHENIVCSNCGSSTTGGNWYRTYDKDGNWYLYEKKYHCNRCNTYFNPNTGKFSRNPGMYKIHENTVCSDCGSNTTNNNWYKKRDKNGNWGGKYICVACYQNPAYRSGELSPNSNVYKGMIGVETVAEVLGDKDCIIMKEGSPFDICSIQSLRYGKIEVKTIIYRPKYGCWTVNSIKPGLFDTLFVICTDNKFENIIRVYIIDGMKIGNIKGITIIENPSYCNWHEEFRVDDIVQYQKVFKIVKNKSQISKNYIDNDQDYMSNTEKGDICEDIVRMTINAEISVDIRYDLIHKEYKKIEVKGSDYHSRHKKWHVGYINSVKFNTLFVVCMNNNFEEVQRVYIIPKEDVGNVSGIAIFENPSIDGWYKKFRVKDIKPYQEACKKVLKNYGR